MKKLLIPTLFSTFLLSACSTSSQTNLEPAKERYDSYRIENISNTIIDQRVTDTFANSLNKALSQYGYKIGDNLIINYDIQKFDEGNRALRYLIGFGAGKATTKIKTILVAKEGKSLGSIDTDASLSMGIFGGDGLTPVENAAKDIAQKIHQSGVLVK